MGSAETILVPAQAMQSEFYRALIKYGVPEKKSKICARIFTENTLDGVYTHGVYRFPRLIEYVAALTYQMIYEQPVVYELGSLKPSTVLIIGTKDKTIVGKDKLSKELQQLYGNYNVLGKQAAAKIPGSKLIELNAGHIPHIEIPGEFTKALLSVLQ